MTGLNRNLQLTQKDESYSKNSIDVTGAWRTLARIDYEFYVEYVHRGLYTHGRHTKYICHKLQQVEEGLCKRLMLLLPPRHSKSMTVSETFPSFFIGKNPERRVIQSSYGESLARRFGRSNRMKLNDFGEEVFGITVDKKNSSVTNWSIEGHRGGMISAGIGGAITGEGADLLLIDDPIKNRKEADSETYRNMVWDEWQNTLLTRLQPGGAVILIMTRWHEDDLAGRLLNPEYGQVDDWEVIRLPAIAEKDDLLGREIGEPLWAEFGFDTAWAEKTRIAVGSQTWASLYQQRPSPAEGSIVRRDWWKYYKQLPSMDVVIQSWDCSFKETQDGSYVVGQVWGRKGPNKYLIDQFRSRVDFVGTLQALRTMTGKHPHARLKLIEDKANGPAVISTLRSEISGIVPVLPQGSKESRLHAVSPDIEAGNVYIPDPSIAPWVHDYVEELAAFPNGANDDQVDATTQALLELGGANKRRVQAVDRRLLGI